MESQADVVVAAEALRMWVQAQRAGWKNESSTSASALLTPPVPPQAARQAPPVAAAPVAAREVAPLVAPPAPAPSRPPAVVSPPLSDGLEREAHLPTEAPEWAPAEETSSRGWLRAVAALAAVAVLAGGAVLGYPSLKRVVAARQIGSAVFDSVPPGAQVLVDGNPVGSTPVRVELPVGSHAVELKLKAARRRQTLEIARGREAAVNVDWNARPVGRLQISSTPTGARVLVDGRERGETPLTLDELAVGTHTVQIESSEGSVRRQVVILAGKTESMAESIYPGWVYVSAPVEVTVWEGSRGIQLDDRNRALLKPGVHDLRIENRELEFSETRQVAIEPGGTANVAIDTPLSTLSITGSTGAEVFVDGVKAGVTPLTDFQVKLGTRDIMVIEPSGATRHATVTVTTKPAQVDISFARP